jgi:hypothetical protein
LLHQSVPLGGAIFFYISFHLSFESEPHSAIHLIKVSSGGRTIKLRTRSSSKVKDWVTAINAARQPPEGWCYPHRFGSFAPPRGLMEDGSMVQWFIDGQAAFEAIASCIEEAKSEVNLFILFISYCRMIPYMYASQITE